MCISFSWQKCVAAKGFGVVVLCRPTSPLYHSRPYFSMVGLQSRNTSARVYVVHFILVVVRSVSCGKGARLFCAQRSSSPLVTFSTVGLQSMHNYSCVCMHRTFRYFAGRSVPRQGCCSVPYGHLHHSDLLHGWFAVHARLLLRVYASHISFFCW